MTLTFFLPPFTENDPLTDFISESPHVVLKGVDVMKTKMWVLWQYSPGTSRAKGEKDTCSVQIQYRTTSDKEYRSDGTKVSAEMVTCNRVFLQLGNSCNSAILQRLN